MSTQWTSSPSSRLMRWRVRDWVSCFLASRIPLDDGPSGGNFRDMMREYNMNDGNSNAGRSQRVQYRRKSRHRKERRVKDVVSGDCSRNNNNNNGEVSSGLETAPLSGKGEETSTNGRVDETTADERRGLLVDGTSPATRRRHRNDQVQVKEDYIVFCFGENGAFEVVKDGRHRRRSHNTLTSSGDHGFKLAAENNMEEVVNSSSSASKPTVNRKLNYGNRDESAAGKGRWEEKRSLSSTIQQDIVGSSVKPEELLLFQQWEENHSSTREMPRHPLGEIDGNQLGGGAVAESNSSSRDSPNHSHSSSSGSFSFPVLQWEEMVGSPVQMPKPEDFHLRKHRMNCARFQCCRFHRNSID